MVATKLVFLQNEGRKRIRKYFLFILKIFLFSTLINCISANEVRRLDGSVSTVILVVEGTGGEQKIVSDEFELTPSEIIVGGNSVSNIKTYDLAVGTFDVTLKFNSGLTTLAHMFKSVTNIKEVDFSGFDFSNVESMNGMFFGCSDLEKVYFGETNAPAPTDVEELFQGCSKLQSVDLSKFDFSRAPSFNEMFLDCRELTEVKFGNMASPSSLISMNQTFQNCAKIESIDLSMIIFSKVTNMESMFHNCENLKQVKFGTSKTDELQYMRQLFGGCSNIISLDLSNFNYVKVIDMDMAFKGCSNIKQINLGESGTRDLKQMSQLFEGCSKLTSIDLTRFTTTQVTTMASMFKDCSSIKYFYLDNFQTTSITDVSSMFSGTSFFFLKFHNLLLDASKNWTDIFKNVPKNVVICMNDENTRNLVLESDRISFCSDTCKETDNSKIVINEKKCVKSCKVEGGEYKYEYKNVCYKNCPIGTFEIDFTCIDCEDGKPIGFYLDPNNDGVYKKCFETCKFCNGPGNESDHNCLECNSGFRFIPNLVNDKNCYQNCSFYYYLDGSNTYHCTSDEICPSPYNILIQQKENV